MNSSRNPRPQRSLANLLRAAGNTYATAIRQRLAQLGCDDVPRDGAFVLTAIRYSAATPADLVRSLGISKQAVSQLLDALVQRGYLQREIHAEDRRRISIELTERGNAAAAGCREAADQVERRVVQVVGAAAVAQARATLAAIVDLELERPAAA
jgi:DNA-binding MarR family transcriptional regulator